MDEEKTNESQNNVGGTHPVQRFVRPELCKLCQGSCCKSLPCSAFPADFGLPNTEKITAAIDSGKWCIDWWEGDPREHEDVLDYGYYVRPAIKEHEGERSHASWGGECTFLTSKGCELSIEARPFEGRMLEPKSDYPHGCKSHSGGKQAAAIAWIPFWDLLDSLKNSEVERKAHRDMPLRTFERR